MTNPTCAKCDCVAGCQAKPVLCPNVAVTEESAVNRWDKYVAPEMAKLASRVAAHNAAQPKEIK